MSFFAFGKVVLIYDQKCAKPPLKVRNFFLRFFAVRLFLSTKNTRSPEQDGKEETKRTLLGVGETRGGSRDEGEKRQWQF